MRTPRALVALSASALLLTACGSLTADSSDGRYAFSRKAIAWAPCPATTVAGLQCATYTVPLDYRHAEGKTITLALRRMPATGTSRGTVFFNPGGPGGTGTGQFPEWLGQFPAQLRQSYDLVSWDPRGVGLSTAVQCYPNGDAEGAVIGDLGTFPVTYAEQAAYTRGYQAFAQQCAATQREIAAHVSTADSARDLEQLRIASGGAPLNYWGVSYGTFLGATYANLFPRHIRSLVLDGNLSPLAWTNDGHPDAQQSVGMRIGSMQNADVFDQFLSTCAAAGPKKCAFAGATFTATKQKWDAMLASLALKPVTVQTPNGPDTIGAADLVSQMSNGLDIVWPIEGSASGWSGNAGALQSLYEAITAAPAKAAAPRAAAASTTPGSYVGAEQPLSITCGDVARPSAARIPSLAVEAQQQAGYFGLSTLYNDFPCTFWTIKAADPYAGPWDKRLSARPLVVNTTHDPSTPYQNATAMAELLDGAVLLTVNGYGHTSLLNPSACAYDHITRYILTGALPAAGTYCAQDIQPFER